MERTMGLTCKLPSAATCPDGQIYDIWYPSVDTTAYDEREASTMRSMPASDDGYAVTISNVAGLGAFLVTVAPFANSAASAVIEGEAIGLLVIAIVLGVVAADLGSGLLHWICDSFFSEQTPVIGQHLIRPFREHHRDPFALTRRPFLRGSASNLIGATAVLATAWGVRQLTAGPGSPFADVWVASLGIAVAVTNQIHKWAHLPRVPRPISWLQALGLILSPAHHERHHSSELGRAFCITTGWLNPALDRLQVFPALERLLIPAERRRAVDVGS